MSRKRRCCSSSFNVLPKHSPTDLTQVQPQGCCLPRCLANIWAAVWRVGSVLLDNICCVIKLPEQTPYPAMAASTPGTDHKWPAQQCHSSCVNRPEVGGAGFQDACGLASHSTTGFRLETFSLSGAAMTKPLAAAAAGIVESAARGPAAEQAAAWQTSAAAAAAAAAEEEEAVQLPDSAPAARSSEPEQPPFVSDTSAPAANAGSEPQNRMTHISGVTPAAPPAAGGCPPTRDCHMLEVINGRQSRSAGSTGFKLQHPTAQLLQFLLAAGAAASSISYTHFHTPNPCCLHPNMLKPLAAQTTKLFMSPQAEEYHLSNPEVAPSARCYLAELPPQLILPAVQALLAATEGPDTVQVVHAGDELVAALETRRVLLVRGAKAAESIAVCLPVDWQPPPCRRQQQPLAEQQHELQQQQLAPKSGSSAGSWVMVDPLGDFENVFDALSVGNVFYYCPAHATADCSSCCQASDTSAVVPTSNRSTSCHVLFTVLGYSSGLLDFKTGLQGLRSTYESLLQPMHDAEFGLACLTTLLLQGEVSVGLLGVKLDTAAQGSMMTEAAEHHPLPGWGRSARDREVEQNLAAWQDGIQATAAAWRGPLVTWEDVHNLSDVLHHLDGYTAADGHTFFVSCHNRSSGTPHWHLASADISLPLYQQQHMRWMVTAPAAGRRSDGAAAAAVTSTWQPTRSYSEVILHQSCAHFTLNIINHQHQVCMHFDSLGNPSCPGVMTPGNYEQVTLSKRIQGSATCGPHALFVALAYAADLCGLRSLCSLSEADQHESDSSGSSNSRDPSGCSTTGGSSVRGAGSKRYRASMTAIKEGRKRKRHTAKDSKRAAADRADDRRMGSRAARLQHALASCYGFAAGRAQAKASITCSKADAVVSAAYQEATRLIASSKQA